VRETLERSLLVSLLFSEHGNQLIIEHLSEKAYFPSQKDGLS